MGKRIVVAGAAALAAALAILGVAEAKLDRLSLQDAIGNITSAVLSGKADEVRKHMKAGGSLSIDDRYTKFKKTYSYKGLKDSDVVNHVQRYFVALEFDCKEPDLKKKVGICESVHYEKCTRETVTLAIGKEDALTLGKILKVYDPSLCK